MEIQEALNRAILGIVKQGRLASSSAGGCFYQMGNCGPRCAVGQLLNDAQLSEIAKFEVNSAPVTALVSRGILPESFRHQFFSDLQEAHDNARDVFEFLEGAKQIAAQYDLTLPELPDLSNLPHRLEALA